MHKKCRYYLLGEMGHGCKGWGGHTVLDPSKGVCHFGGEGTGPPVGVSERQLSPDRRGEKT